MFILRISVLAFSFLTFTCRSLGASLGTLGANLGISWGQLGANSDVLEADLSFRLYMYLTFELPNEDQ